MFKIDPSPKFTATVTVQVPGEGEQSFTAYFHALPVSAFNEYDLTTGAGTVEFLQRVWFGLEDVVLPNDDPLKWSDASRDSLLDYAWVRRGLVAAYIDGVNGASAKN